MGRNKKKAVKRAEKRSRKKWDRIKRERNRKLKAESGSPASISDTDS